MWHAMQATGSRPPVALGRLSSFLQVGPVFFSGAVDYVANDVRTLERPRHDPDAP